MAKKAKKPSITRRRVAGLLATTLLEMHLPGSVVVVDLGRGVAALRLYVRTPGYPAPERFDARFDWQTLIHAFEESSRAFAKAVDGLVRATGYLGLGPEGES